MTLPTDAMAQLFAALPGNDLPEIPRYNVCPTTQVHAVWSEGEGRRLGAMRWGFIPHWYKKPNDGPLLINARSETIADKPAFRSAARSRRCILPASGFFEWTRDGDLRLPWYIYRRDGAPLAFAGVWQDWERDGDTHRSCAIVTCAANTPMQTIHHRMPVILEPDDWPLWLGEAGKGAARLMQPAEVSVLDFHRVDPAVNSNRAQGPDLVNPIEI